MISRLIARCTLPEPEGTASTTTHTSVDSDQLDTVSRFTLVYHIVIKDNVNTPWKLTRGCSLGHLLDTDSLVILENAMSVLHFERVPCVVLLGRDNGRWWEISRRSRITVLLVVE